jgi:toxin ParE1/3/4
MAARSGGRAQVSPPAVRLEWTDPAIDDIDRIYSYIAHFNTTAASRLATEIVVAADRLAVFPNIGRVGRVVGTREVATVWPYVLVYEVTSNAVRVLRVWHGAQDRAPE